jgi:G:T/U-mismatch repair DNA glycosylase
MSGPVKGADADFFYGSEHNMMWVYLEEATGKKRFAKPRTAEAEAEATEDLMQELLREHRLWMQDVLLTYRRRAGCQNSPFDKDIDINASDTTFLDFSSVLESGCKIERIVFTSMTAAEWFFSKILTQWDEPQTKSSFSDSFAAAKKARSVKGAIERFSSPFFSDTFSERKIDFFVAPSPSSLALTPNLKTCAEIYRQIISGSGVFS